MEIQIFFCLFLLFRAHGGIWRFPGLGANGSYSCWPTPQPQPRRIRATSATFTAAHNNVGSLTHWARLGIEPRGSQSDSFPLSHNGNSTNCLWTYKKMSKIREVKINPEFLIFTYRTGKSPKVWYWYCTRE